MGYQYEVAISFAGEDRTFVQAVANGLKEAGVKVFYDDFYAAKLWGEDLSAKLREVYHDSSEFCIMIISQHYAEKMWTVFERQQAIERLIREKGKAYVLPVRLDGFAGAVPGLSGSISYLAIASNEPQIVINTFLEKIGRNQPQASASSVMLEAPKLFLPKIKRSFSDKEKNSFLKDSFKEIIDLMEQFLRATKNEHSHFDYEFEEVSSRKSVFTVYRDEKQITQFKIWLGGSFGSDQICFLYGTRIDVENDGSMNDWVSLVEQEGELKLQPAASPIFGTGRENFMAPREVAEYLWKIVCQSLS